MNENVDTTVVTPKRLQWVLGLLFACVVTIAAIWLLNLLLINKPIQDTSNLHYENARVSLRGHYQYYINPKVLVLDLRNAESIAPVVLYRELFQAAATLHQSGRQFDQVVLARAGDSIFVVEGEVFDGLGSGYAAGQNPIYLMRTLPENLMRPDGTAAFDRWSGGWLGVMTRQIEDANEAARQWAMGHDVFQSH